ncbi:transient receptor potential cation channel subfamily A member 1-like [Babylonia areolata]|uniref:transient receptor potential cation channel subfamily A member 1-like n=1 Tax=Babylonia areolata TaxID=304850 RepID=UPI003FD1DADF
MLKTYSCLKTERQNNIRRGCCNKQTFDGGVMEEEEEQAWHGGAAALELEHSEALYRAVIANNVADLQQLLSQGATPDMFYDDDANISSKYILHIACGKGNKESIQVLLDAGAMPDCHDSWGQTPLHYCISMQFLDCAQTVLEHLGPNAPDIVNNQDCHGKSSLHAAAEQGQVEAIHLLLQHGAQVNIRNFDGVTPLMVCAETCGKKRSIEPMQALIEAGALVDLFDYRSKRTALQRASVAKNVDGVELLLSVGAQVDLLDVTRRTALTNLMWDHVRNRQGVCNIDADVMTVVVLLTQSGADLNLSVCEYSNPLVTASFLQAAPLLHFFLDQGAQPNITFSSGVTPLLIATSRKDEDCVKTLLAYNCCMTTKGRVFRKRMDREFTFDPIEMALDDGSYRLVQVFLAAGYNACLIRTQLTEKLAADKVSMDADLHQWLKDRVSSPPSLRELVVYSLRLSLDQRLLQVVPLLPLPSRVKDSILLTDLLRVN